MRMNLNTLFNAGVKISVDSVSQLELFGRINPGGRVAFRVNPGVGAGHHEKVRTAGQKTKFGIEMSSVSGGTKNYQRI